jgi:hypothetical protein
MLTIVLIYLAASAVVSCVIIAACWISARPQHLRGGDRSRNGHRAAHVIDRPPKFRSKLESPRPPASHTSG